jgi:hypothetical protein
MTIIHNTIAAACVPLTAIFGSKIGNYVATTHPIPDWLMPLLGPAGALVGTLLAIRWLLTKLDKAEAKADLRDIERDKNLTMIATMTTQNQTVIEQNSEVLAEVKEAVKNFKS